MLFKVIKITNKRTQNNILGEGRDRQRYLVFFETESLKVMIVKRFTFSHKNTVLIES